MIAQLEFQNLLPWMDGSCSFLSLRTRLSAALSTVIP